MDDLLKSLSKEKYLKTLATFLISALGNCDFKLAKALSNSSNILMSLSSSEFFPELVNLDFSSQPVERVFGILWDIKLWI